MSSQADTGSHGSKKYVWIWFVLLFLTCVTVTVSRLHFGFAVAVFVALSIALFKGSLVASFFMHLLAEKKIVALLFMFAIFLFLILIGLVWLGYVDVYQGLRHVP